MLRLISTTAVKTAAIAKTPALQISAKPSRFWKQTKIKCEKSSGLFQITLDERPLKSPAGNIITLKKRGLAELVKAEWDSMDKTSIVVRAIDSINENRVGVVDNLLRYLTTDTVLYHNDAPPALVEMQNQHWSPLVQWAQDTYQVDLAATTDILGSVNPDALAKFKIVIEMFDDMKLAAFEKAVMQSKSFLIALALVNKHISVEEASIAARVEVLHQIKRWGEVEDAHDVDREDMLRQLGSVACLFIENE